MRCPFPGMDPYLEHPGVWEHFHHQFLANIQVQLSDASPDHYDMHVGEEVRVVAPDKFEPRSMKPDVAVVLDRIAPRTRFQSSDVGTALLEPAELEMAELDWTELRLAWLEVRRLPGRELVTVIELLSPWNKGDGHFDFVQKRRAALRRGVHWVELDLLVGGQRTPLAQARPPGDFHAQVTRAERPQTAQVYSWSVRAALPTIPIPLRAPDPDLPLDLAEAFSVTYDRSRLDKALRSLYEQPPEARFSDADREWAAAMVR